MSISLQENATPTCVTTARRVPKHYEPESKKTVTELIDKGVITPVNEATAWCSPAFFVPKADGKRVRLVMDFTALNKFMRRPTHPFPSTREIIEAMSSNVVALSYACLLYTSPSPRDRQKSRMPSSA